MADLTDKQQELIEKGGWIHASIIIEVQGNDKGHIRDALEKLVDRLKEEKGITIYNTEFSDITNVQEKENWLSIHIDIDLLAKDFGRLTHIALLYSPSAVEIHKAKELKITVGEAENIMIDIANVVTSLAQAVFIQEGRIRQVSDDSAQNAPKKEGKNNTKS